MHSFKKNSNLSHHIDGAYVIGYLSQVVLNGVELGTTAKLDNI